MTICLDSGNPFSCPRQGLLGARQVAKGADCTARPPCLLGKGQRELGLGWKFPYRVIVRGPHFLKPIPKVFFQLGECCIKNGEGCHLDEPYN